MNADAELCANALCMRAAIQEHGIAPFMYCRLPATLFYARGKYIQCRCVAHPIVIPDNGGYHNQISEEEFVLRLVHDS